MTKESPDVFIAADGEEIEIAVTSVNFDLDANFDPALSVTVDAQFRKVGTVTMGDASMAFTIFYNFPDPVPPGGKYTRTITGPDGFQDGPFDIPPDPAQSVVPISYVFKLAPATVHRAVTKRAPAAVKRHGGRS
jgi:hypothetical protein